MLESSDVEFEGLSASTDHHAGDKREHAEREHGDAHDRREHAEREHGDAHAERKHADEHAGSHTELHASYRFRCAAPAKLRSLTVSLFPKLRQMEELRVRIVTATQQRALNIGPGDRSIRIRD